MSKEMKSDENLLSNIAARRGIFYQSFPLYKEVGGFYDYGPIGFRIRRNIKRLWRRNFVDRLGALELESTIIMPEEVFKASGHLSSFTDPVAVCPKCKRAYRVDKLLEEFYKKKGSEKSLEGASAEQLEKELRANKIKCENCGTELIKVSDFNMMFKTQIGALGSETAYLRPETAQGIFVDFRNLFKIYGLRLPVAMAQIGKVFRNEISPRQHLVRMREFTQMELEVFFDPGQDTSFENLNMNDVLNAEIAFVPKDSESAKKHRIGELMKSGKIVNKHFAALLYLEVEFFHALGIPDALFRFKEIGKPPHYSKGNIDLELMSPYGYIEIAGNAYRTDYDLSSHARQSGIDTSVINDGKKVVPHVVEASMGLDRLFLALLSNSAQEDKERGWNWLKINESVAPYRYAVLPLQKDEELVTKAREVSRLLIKKGIQSYYSESGSIGKRYARADEIGVSYCVTIDYDTLKNNTVTIRSRDDAKQVRVEIEEIS